MLGVLVVCVVVASNWWCVTRARAKGWDSIRGGCLILDWEQGPYGTPGSWSITRNPARGLVFWFGWEWRTGDGVMYTVRRAGLIEQDGVDSRYSFAGYSSNHVRIVLWPAAVLLWVLGARLLLAGVRAKCMFRGGCTNCGYSFAGLAAEGDVVTCPECGKEGRA